MRTILVSKERGLFAFLREVLCQSPIESQVLMVAPGKASGHADLYIWDFQPGVPIPDDLSPLGPKHLFLVNRKDLPIFAENSPAEAGIILKPATPGAIYAFLSGFWERMEGGSHSLRKERDDILQGLIQANLKLQEYDQDRTNFLARAVHDFRTPLTAISGYCGLLLSEQLGTLTEDQRDVAMRMERSAKRLTRIASAMFQLSVGRRIEQKPNMQRGDIRECIDQALHEIAPFSQEKRIDISADIEAPMEMLCFEQSQVEQVLINLLDNACKFTPRMGTIEIRGYPFFWERRAPSLSDCTMERRIQNVHAANSYRVDIRDSGPGIPTTHLGRIFEEYTSYGGPQDRSGGGLGLAICRMILRNHGGRIWTEPSSAGAIFSFVLPFYRPELPRSRSATIGVDSLELVQQR